MSCEAHSLDRKHTGDGQAQHTSGKVWPGLTMTSSWLLTETMVLCESQSPTGCVEDGAR
jgi:hypothetical protein